MRRRGAVVVLLLAALLGACSSPAHRAASSTPVPPGNATAPSTSGATGVGTTTASAVRSAAGTQTAAAAIRAGDFINGITGYIQPAGFVKLREVTLSYELPPSLVHSMFGDAATSVRLEASGRNLVTWTKYGGLDPEVSNFGNQNINRGQDVAPYPPSRSFFFTVGVDF